MVGGRPRIDVHAGLEGEGVLATSSAKAMFIRVGVFTLSLLFVLACLAGNAQAAPETIAEYGEGAGEVRDPIGVAVDPTGDLYVAEANNNRISKFDSHGNFLFAFGYGVADGITPELQTCGPEASPPTINCFLGQPNLNPDSVAVDESGDVYVSAQHRVLKFTSTGQLIFEVGKNVNKTKEGGGGASQAEKDFCAVSSGDLCDGAEVGTGANEFSGDAMPLAVDSAGMVWVGDRERLVSFDSSSGTPGAEIALPGAGDIKSLALNSSGDFYIRSESVVGIQKLAAGTGTLLETLDVSGEPLTVTVDEGNHVYVGDSAGVYRFKVYSSDGEQIASFGVGQVIGDPGVSFFGSNSIAVDSAKQELYAASSRPEEAESVVQGFPIPKPGPLPENQHVEDLLPTSTSLVAELNPEGHETTYHFDWGTSESYGETTPTETLPGEEFDFEVVKAGLEELTPSTTYHFRLCATNSAGTVCGPDTTFTTPPAVVINPEWVSNVSAHSATLNAELNPLGVEAEAWLEYGISEGYGQVVPLANLGEGFNPVLRQATVTGLQAATTYHYRFSARDTRDGKVYTVHGVDRTFTTQLGGLGFQLPDDRVWELVSPPDKHGARLVGGGEFQIQASADGNGLAYQSYLSPETDPEGNRILEPSMNLAHRQTDGSWRSKDITTPNEYVTQLALGAGGEYKLFNSDLSKALLEPLSGTPLSPEASSERAPYLRENTEPPAYTPLVTGKEPYANVPPGTKFGGGPGEAKGNVHVEAASSDFQHFGLVSGVPLVEIEGPPPIGKTLYEWSSGQIEPVSVSPADEGGEIVAGDSIGSGRRSVDGALSRDGSRVFWSTVGALYLRYNATEAPSVISGGKCTEPEKACTVRIDVKKQPGPNGPGTPSPVFQGASDDGTVVFFTDSQQLTEDASPKGADLYRCELSTGSVASGCASLTDLSVPMGAHESGEVQGIAAAVTADGTKAYFVADGVLDKAQNKLGGSAISRQPNLYMWQQGKGVRFIATLSDEDRTDWGQAEAISSNDFEGALTATASPSGRYLGFMSQRSLTGYDNRDESSGEAAEEMFRYDSSTEQLECVSCQPTGARAHSAVPSQAYRAFVDPWNLWPGRLVAAALPEATSTGLSTTSVSLYRPRAVLDNGRVFFNAIDSLAPADSNGQWDVYQYEPTGVGDCSSSSAGASISHVGEGCVSLISSGTAEEEAAFVDADETGDNAFFWTPAQLSVLDEDHEVDIYDARVNGIPATLPPNTECLGEACQPAAQAPSDPTPASAAYHGPGNVKRCGRHQRLVRRKGHARCVKKRHRHRHHGEHQRAHRNRRAQR
jgi:NHL repeat